jgi:hypothetical protein
MRTSLLALTLLVFPVQAQLTLQESHTQASLRGVHSLDGKIAWASGTAGTVLRTTDGGVTWQPCAVPPGAEKLDFRAVQAFDENTALVMSAGTGDLSRLYKTTDACHTWKLVLSNPDPQGFWDALQFRGPGLGVLIGDPVDGYFPVYLSEDGGNTWRKPDPKGLRAEPTQAIFAASNSSLLIDNGRLYLLTGGIPALISQDLQFASPPTVVHPPLAAGEAAGGFSLAAKQADSGLTLVAVGGNYKAPNETKGVAVFCDPACHPSDTSPHGYRSAVAYDESTKTWIAAGPNGVDLSANNGRTWTPLDAGKNWNAISLPFLVGAHGQIGVLKLP